MNFSNRTAISVAALAGLAVVAFIAVQFTGIKVAPRSGNSGSNTDRVQIPRNIKWIPAHMASAEAIKAKHPIFCFFSIASNRSCRRMEQEIFADQAVADILNSKFTPVMVIYDGALPASATEKIVTRNYGVKKFPTILITDQDGVKLTEQSGFVSKGDIIKFLALRPQPAPIVPVKSSKRQKRK